MTNPVSHPRLFGLLCLVLGLGTLALYAPALHHDFVAYDDQQYVTENGVVQAGLTGPGLAWAFGRHANNWHPLTWVSHMLDCQFFGLKPAGHHLTSLLLHTVNTLLLFLLFHRLTGATWRSGLVAALFAWHPLHVESVAWIAERKDVLCGFFWLLTLLAYAGYARRRAPGPEPAGADGTAAKTQPPTPAAGSAPLSYALAVLLFALALMSKPMAVTLPCVLLLIDYWPLHRFQAPTGRSQLYWEKAPFFALAVLSCVLTLGAQQQAMASTGGLGVAERLGHALLAYVHYLGALFVPIGLAVHYPYARSVPAAKIILAGVLLAGITVLGFRWTRSRPYLLTGWLWFLGTLVPVIGLIQVGDQAWADRYTYLPSIGVFLMLVWGLGDWVEAAHPNPVGVKGLVLAAGLALVLITSRQLRYWQDTRTLFTRAAGVTQHNSRAIAVLGSLFAAEGKLEEAVKLCRQALSYDSNNPEAHFFLGRAYEQQGKLDLAADEYRAALWFKPLRVKTHLFLGLVLAKQGNSEEAAANYRAALALDPQFASAENNLARLLHTQGRLDEAIQHYTEALRLDPQLPQARNNLGVLLLQKGRVAEGAAQLREAVRLNPGDVESLYNLALALNQQQEWKEAAAILARLGPDRPQDANLHYQLGLAQFHLRQTQEARSHLAHALLLQADFPEALDRLSWILSTDPHAEFRNGPEALRMAQRACELTGERQALLEATLAAAYAETGQFPEAVRTAQTALTLAVNAGQTNLAAQCQSLIETARSGTAWREQP